MAVFRLTVNPIETLCKRVFFSFFVRIFLSSRLLERYLEFFNCLRYTLVALYRRQVNSCVLIYGAFLYPKEWDRYQLFLESYNSLVNSVSWAQLENQVQVLLYHFPLIFWKNRTNLDRRKFGVITSKKTSWLVVSFPICHEYTAIMINPKKNSSWICNKVRTILPINWNPKANYFFDIVQRISKVIYPPSPLFFFFFFKQYGSQSNKFQSADQQIEVKNFLVRWRKTSGCKSGRKRWDDPSV